jgi:hypothetical protein
MSDKKIILRNKIQMEIVKANAYLIENEENDDSTTGYGHWMERERGRIDGFKMALEFFETLYGDDKS